MKPLELFYTEDYCLLISNTTIKKHDLFISLDDDESYLDIIESTVEDFSDYADSDWTKNCKKILAYRHLDTGALSLNLPFLPSLPLIKDETGVFSKEDLANYLFFVEDNYHYHSSGWYDRETDVHIKREDMLSAYIKSLKTQSNPKWFIPEYEYKDNYGNWYNLTESIPIEIMDCEIRLKTESLDIVTIVLGTYKF